MALADPVRTAYFVRGRLRPSGLFARHASRARRVGLSKLHLVLSFDCDTQRDIEVVAGVHGRLAALGVRPVYAVPGELLERGAEVYRPLAEQGAEFLNHGYREHTRFDAASGRYTSTFFYDEEPRAAVRRDVLEGDRAVRDVLAVAPRGFRAPHFGTFQRPAELRFLHGVLRELGYAYSSSTMPLYGFRHGPAFARFGLWELPVTGLASAPLSILDSYGFYAQPGRRHAPEDFHREGVAVAAAHQRAGAGIINVYADPSHVHASEPFFATVERWREVATPTSYGELLPLLR